MGQTTRILRFFAWWPLERRREEEPVDREPYEQPRPLTAREREVLDFLLTPDLPGIEELREQAETALAVRWGARDPSFNLYVDQEATRPSPLRKQEIETETKLKSAKDLRFLMLWVDEDGWLSYVELAHLYEEWPEDLPRPSELEPPRPYEPGRRNREK